MTPFEDKFGIGRAHSTDGLGVKRWQAFVAGGSQVVSLFDRKEAQVSPRFMLRIMTRSGEHVSTQYRATEKGIVALLKREAILP